METASDLCLVLTTWPADQPVETFAAQLVSENLAACVSVLAPMTSHYRWQGAVERADERLDAAASTTYGAWVRDSTSEAAGG